MQCDCHLLATGERSLLLLLVLGQLVESTCNAGVPGSIPGSGRSPGEGLGYPSQYSWFSLVAQLVKNLPEMRETWVGKIPWRRKRLPTLLFWPGEVHGQSVGLRRVRLDLHFHFLTFLLQVVVLQKNSRKITTAPGNKIKKKSFLVPFAEKLISPHRKGATGAKFPKDRRSAKLEDHEKRAEVFLNYLKIKG